ncbi:hypothetical protein G9A89_020858 [Geosiphon pyriformis]|nr:hypothetical protein G9A89_020858 [Geosiphon pyriformis]
MNDINLAPQDWQILGPFPTGTREQDFGADPLEAYGGIGHLNFCLTDTYPSELGDNGVVGWSTISTNDDGSIGPFDFPNVRWSFNQRPFGWAFNQFQLWAVGKFQIPSIRSDHHGDNSFLIPIKIQCYNIGDFYVNDRRLFGDWYNYQKSWNILHLSPGEHTIRVRVVNEIRIFGGQVPPVIGFKVAAHLLDQETKILVLKNTAIVPDIVDGRLAGEWMSLGVLNTTQDWVTVLRVEIVENNEMISASISEDWKLERNSGLVDRIAPSQQRNIKIKINITTPIRVNDEIASCHSIFFTLRITLKAGDDIISQNIDRINLKLKKQRQPFKFTFEDFDGTIQYAMLIPPNDPTMNQSKALLIGLHGAGVEADMPFWVNAIKPQQNAWGPSTKNVFSAIEHLKRVPFVYISDNNVKLLAGHSNGGQGAWFILSHHPDLFIAGAPAAGYTKIQHYVPYYWNSEFHIDPILKGILEASISEKNNDLYASNLVGISSNPNFNFIGSNTKLVLKVGIPILARTGSDDDNVPPIHSRTMIRLINEHSHNPHAAKIKEDQGKGHWFDEILGDETMQSFYDEHLLTEPTFRKNIQEFTLTLINPASFGTKNGIKIEQLEIPYRLGKIKVEIKDGPVKSVWNLHTSNIRRFSLVQEKTNSWPFFIIDGKSFFSDESSHLNFFKINNEWEISTDETWKLTERNSKDYGPASQILESPGPLQIVFGTRCSPKLLTQFLEIAQEIANSWHLYGNGDSLILTDSEFKNDISKDRYNLVLLGGPKENLVTGEVLENRPSEVKFEKDGSYKISNKHYQEKGTGILFLHPFNGQLALIIAGIDSKGLDIAAKLFPKRTGVPIPDWIIVGPEISWKGAGGLLGAGFWDNQWNYNPAIAYLS